MKQFKLTFLLTVLMGMVGEKAFAHDIEVKNADGVTIYYTYMNNETELAVSYRGSSYSSYSNEYSGVVNIPESVTYNGTIYPVTSIGYRAFSDCSSLTSVTIPNSVTSIGAGAFSGCSGLTSVTIPNSVTSIGQHAFEDCSGLTEINVDENNTAYSSIDGVLFNKSQTELVCYPGGKQGAYTIPNSVTSIGNSAFWGCTGLTSVTIPNSVTSIGQSAFGGCSGLTSVTIGNSVTSIEVSAFYNCSGLTSVTIPNSVTSIGQHAFYGCSGLTSVTINSNAFLSKSYSQSSNMRNIFGSQVKNYTIGDGVTAIGNYAFYGCSGLTSITIGNSVTSIEESAFARCTGLTSITIGNSVTSIGQHAFYGCSSLTSVTIGNSVTTIGDYAFSGCSGLTSVYIPDSVKTIGNYMFQNCSGLTSIYIPDSVKTIGNYTFQNCSGLTSVTIGNSVTNLGDYAFAGCTNITKLTSCATTPPICGTQALNDINKWDCTLVVPVGSKSAYQAADQWKDFFFIEESDVTAINRIYDDEAEGRIVGIYDLNGRKLERLQRGMNIVRMSDGTTKKIVVK